MKSKMRHFPYQIDITLLNNTQYWYWYNNIRTGRIQGKRHCYNLCMLEGGGTNLI